MSLDEIFAESKTTRPGCPVCGEQNAATVIAKIVKLDEHGHISSQGKGFTRQRGVSLCERHATELWDTLRILVNARRSGDD